MTDLINTDTNVNGVYPSQWIIEAMQTGIISCSSGITPKQVQPNSLDVRLDNTAYRVNCSFLPRHEGMTKKLSEFKWYDILIKDSGTVLERNQVYLFPLQECLALPDHIAASANPKSTTGRLDVFTRLVTDNGQAFDEIPAGYHGRLFLEVVPRSFAIIVRPGDTLAQIRFYTGQSKLTDLETQTLIDNEVLIVDEDYTFPGTFSTLRSNELRVQGGIHLTVRLNGKMVNGKEREEVIGYRAKKNQRPIDLRLIGKSVTRNYWENIFSDSRHVILEPDEFYIFASKELVRLPPAYCAEMVPFDASSGELRTHYAGFFDSGFGYEPGPDPRASAAAIVLEIRNRDVPFLIEAGQPLFRMILLRNIEEPSMLYGKTSGSNYQMQRLRLSKQFPPRKDDETVTTGQGELF